MDDEEQVFKLVLLGDSGVGKSACVLRFVRDQYVEATESTIGAAFLSKSFEIDRRPVRAEIWDTAGQERYRSLAPMYYRGAQAAIVVFDITHRESFEGAKRWVRDLQRASEPGLVIALFGNKLDLAERLRKVDTAEAQAYASEAGLLFYETSARTAHNVSDAFIQVSSWRCPLRGRRRTCCGPRSPFPCGSILSTRTTALLLSAGPTLSTRSTALFLSAGSNLLTRFTARPQRNHLTYFLPTHLRSLLAACRGVAPLQSARRALLHPGAALQLPQKRVVDAAAEW